MNKRVIISVFTTVLLFGCKTETDTFQSENIVTYAPLTVGKYITYNLDSTVFVNLGRLKEVHNYQVKYVVDAQITDNLGRPAYRIFRYIRKTSANPWVTDNTFTAVNTGSTYEFIENNQRYVKLALPIKDSFSWKGNTFIDTESLNSPFRYLSGWNYTYANIAQSLTLGTKTFSNTITIKQADEVAGDPSPNPTNFSEVTFGQEKYAKGIGLVYRKTTHTTFQPGNGGFYEDGSFSVTYTAIDYN